jgi:cytochrome c oxidase subunit 1
MIYAGIAGIIGSSLSFIIRLELMTGSPVYFIGEYHQYNTVITGHALVKIFFFVKPFLIGGMGNWLVPIKIRCPDKAKPR